MITAIGANINKLPGLTADVLSSLDETIPLLALAQGPSNCSVSIAVETRNAYDAQIRIHDQLLAAYKKDNT